MPGTLLDHRNKNKEKKRSILSQANSRLLERHMRSSRSSCYTRELCSRYMRCHVIECGSANTELPRVTAWEEGCRQGVMLGWHLRTDRTFSRLKGEEYSTTGRTVWSRVCNWVRELCVCRMTYGQHGQNPGHSERSRCKTQNSGSLEYSEKDLEVSSSWWASLNDV